MISNDPVSINTGIKTQTVLHRRSVQMDDKPFIHKLSRNFSLQVTPNTREKKIQCVHTHPVEHSTMQTIAAVVHTHCKHIQTEPLQ